MTTPVKPIINLTRGTVVCEHGVLADRILPRTRGLLGRRSLPAGEGLLLKPAPSIHTAFMHFPIDVVFLDRSLQVVKLVDALGPWRLASARRAHAALELAAGEAATRGIEIGDRLEMVTDTAADPIRVLLVGKDRRFRSVTSALLTGRGCTVTLGDRFDLSTMRANRETFDVAVIDVDSAPLAAASEAAGSQIFDPPFGVVFVTDARSPSVPAVPVLTKWGPFDQLYSAIRTARPTGTGGA
jgi:uncharacterized protein